MKYADGRVVKFGDNISINHGSLGKVVCSIDNKQFSNDHPKEQWAYLKHGILIEFVEFGLVHYATELDDDIILVSRGNT